MTSIRPALALWLAPLLAVTGLTGLRPGHAPEWSGEALTPARCSTPTVFTTGYQRSREYVVPRDTGFLFRSDGWVEADVCSGGTLSITAQGELAGTELPQLTVVLGQEVIAAPRFDTHRTVDIAVPTAGRLLLAYFNDYYEADVRVATLRGFKFLGTDCQGFKTITVPRDTGGTWSAQTLYATLVRAVPMTVVPCGSGTMSVILVGRAGGGEFPDVLVAQGGSTLTRVTTSAQPQTVRLAVGPGPLTLTVTNPYGKTIGDRNLMVSRLSYTPQPGP